MRSPSGAPAVPFDESKHRRDAGGKFSTKGPAAEETSVVLSEPPVPEPVETAPPGPPAPFLGPKPGLSERFAIYGQGRYGKQLGDKLREVAGMRGVPTPEAYEGFQRAKAEWEALPADRRPSPPAEWRNGTRGGRWNRTMSDLVTDPGTEWALYRCQADREMFDDTGTEYISVDLEAAMEADDWEPAHGDIIELAAVRYDHTGKELGRITRLYSPSPVNLERFGTGAEHIHNISPEMVAGKPHFSEQAPFVRDVFAGRVMLAHNGAFEMKWLNQHINQAKVDFHAQRPIADTYMMFREHYKDHADKHQLGNASAHFGVPYGEGAHRAEHDARAAGELFFKMREDIYSTYDDLYRGGSR